MVFILFKFLKGMNFCPKKSLYKNKIMKKLLIIFVCFISLNTFSQYVSLDPYYVNNQWYNTETTSIYSNAIQAPQNSSNSDWYNGNSTTNYTAAQYITLQPGFGAQAGISGYYFLGQIGNGSPITNVAVMGSSNTGNQFQKPKIGMNLEKYYLG